MNYGADCHNYNLLGENFHGLSGGTVMLLGGPLDWTILEDFANLSDSMIPFIILCAVGIVNILLPPET